MFRRHGEFILSELVRHPPYMDTLSKRMHVDHSTERKPETDSETPVHWVTENTNTSKQVGKAETHSPHNLHP